jgi:hypothetical protein
MYNTDFKVKYHDIEEELTWKLKYKPKEEEIQEPEYEYSSEDVLDICNKLYRDELTNVFYAEDIFDGKIEKGMKYVLEKMMLNNDFKQFMEEQIKLMIDVYKCGTDIHETDLYFVCLLMLFEQQHFHIFHNCICQQLTFGTIEPTLLDELKKINLFSGNQGTA